MIVFNQIETAQLTEVMNIATGLQQLNYHWTAGNCFFNALYKLYPNTANEILLTELDCNENDDVLTKTILAITK